jgi:photosystem II stability/assembly factor-like uncharacterized protein
LNARMIFRSLGSLGFVVFLLAGCTLLDPHTPGPNNTPAPPLSEAASATPTSAAGLIPGEKPEGSITVSEANLVQLAMFTEFSGWGVGENAVLHTDTGGRFWFPVTPPELSAVGRSASSFFLDQATGWVLAPDAADFTRGTLYRTTDSGNTWQVSDVPFSQAAFSFVDQQFGWAMFISGAAAGSSAAEIFQTTDSGETWRQVYVIDPQSPDDVGGIPFGGSKSGISFATMERGWVTGEIPADAFIYVFRSLDGGSTWSQQDLALPDGLENSLVSFKPPVFFDELNGKLPAVLYGMETVSVIYFSDDGGESWKLTTPIQSTGMVDFPNAQTGFLWDGGQILYGTLDGGVSWNQIPQQFTPRDNLLQIEFVDSESGWALVAGDGSSSRLYQTSDSGSTWLHLP